MIPGNIDLTENLDFRKVVQKEIPQLPANWKKSEINTDTGHITTITNSTTNISFNSNSTYTYRTTYYDDYEENGYGLINTNITSTSLDNISDWTGWITYYDRNTSVISDITFSYDDSTISYNGGKHFKIITKKKKEYDIFGNEKIDYVEDIPSIPWSTKERKESIRNIPWEVYEDYGPWKLEVPSIPWDTIPRWSRVKRFDLDSIVNRAKNLICWLSDKSNRFIESYLDQEEELVDLSYLTNMNWIRVRDVVIDTV